MATPVITMTDPGNVSVDGIHAGALTDVLANYKSVTGINSLVMAALSDHLAARDAAHTQASSAKDETHAEALAEKDTTIADLTAKVVDLESVLGGTKAGQDLIAQREQEARAAQKAELQAKLAELDAADAAAVG